MGVRRMIVTLDVKRRDLGCHEDLIIEMMPSGSSNLEKPSHAGTKE